MDWSHTRKVLVRTKRLQTPYLYKLFGTRVCSNVEFAIPHTCTAGSFTSSKVTAKGMVNIELIVKIPPNKIFGTS